MTTRPAPHHPVGHAAWITGCKDPMNFAGFLLTQSLNALSQASLLFFIACGLTLIFGIMRIINFAHGAIYMLGAYIGYSIAALTGQFWLAIVLAPSPSASSAAFSSTFC
ncbi:MAG: hypothetical protein R3D67_15560 [Hyphomicrobiaceae bacterium]